MAKNTATLKLREDASLLNISPDMEPGRYIEIRRKAPLAAKGFEIISMPPAGSMSAPGADMGRFMLAFLNQALKEATGVLLAEQVQLLGRVVLVDVAAEVGALRAARRGGRGPRWRGPS